MGPSGFQTELRLIASVKDRRVWVVIVHLSAAVSVPCFMCVDTGAEALAPYTNRNKSQMSEKANGPGAHRATIALTGTWRRDRVVAEQALF